MQRTTPITSSTVYRSRSLICTTCLVSDLVYDQPEALALFCNAPQELEKALSKHELIGVKALAQKTKGSGSPGGSGRSSPSSGRSGASSPSQGQSSRQVTELKRSIKDTEAESIATQQRLQQLQEARVQLEAQKGEALQTWHKLQQQQAESRTATADTQAKK